MAVQVLRFRQAGVERWGVEKDEQVLPFVQAFDDLADFLARGAQQARALLEAGGDGLPRADLELLAPVTAPCAVICQGKNYTEHMVETGTRPEEKTYNLFFRKASSAICPGVGTVQRPEGVQLLDYELELGLVIGAAVDRPRELAAEELSEVVAGLVICNDISARDIQLPQNQWFKGKSFRSFCPVGPRLVLLEDGDIERLPELELQLHVDGGLRQQARVRQMLFPPAETLSELSRVLDLRPGDLVLTGTPGGVAMQAPAAWKRKLASLFLSEKEMWQKFVEIQAENGRFLKDGSVIEASIRTPDGLLDLGNQRLEVVA